MSAEPEEWVRFRVARARAGKTLADVARACEVTPQAVKKWEDGKAMPSSSRLLIVCRELDCSVEWLLCADPLDFHSTERAPQGRHAKYWVREALDEYFSTKGQTA